MDLVLLFVACNRNVGEGAKPFFMFFILIGRMKNWIMVSGSLGAKYTKEKDMVQANLKKFYGHSEGLSFFIMLQVVDVLLKSIGVNTKFSSWQGNTTSLQHLDQIHTLFNSISPSKDQLLQLVHPN